MNEFSTTVFKLYSKDFDVKLQFIFDIYDFDKDKFISKEDVILVLSHAPLEKTKYETEKEGKITQNGGCLEEYSDRAETQKELNDLAEVCFKEKEKINITEFKNAIENISSEMFLCLFTLIRTRFPTLADFMKYKQQHEIKTLPLTPKSMRRLAAPKMLSKFSSVSQVVKFSTPKLQSRTLRILKPDDNEESKDSRGSYITKMVKPKSGFAPNPTMPTIMNPVVRLPNSKDNMQDVTRSPTTYLQGKGQGIALFCECGKVINDLDKLICDDCITKKNEPKCEGYLYRKDKSLIKSWYSLDKKDLYCYEKKEATKHRSMHSLVGCFVSEESPEEIDGVKYYIFAIIMSKSTFKRYYTELEEHYKMWIKSLQKALGYSNIADFYELKASLGQGKFGLVKSAVHKKSEKKVAIKIMKKSMMSIKDLELIKQEIEIMKISQHPNLIRLLDVFESVEYIYIVMELMEGGDLFAYLEKRHFRLPERTVARLTHSLAAALYYLHNYGIVHRDLKPENVLMVSTKDDSDVKIMDFGLSKMVGPSQLCTEPFGTLSYVSPEVLLQKPYGKGVDVWSLGILTYLMLSGSLPFDSEDDREIAR